MALVPDTKNWTWVLERPCPECGYDARMVVRADVPRLVRENAAAWSRVLAAPDVGVRPADDVWSPLEYGCHIRDVFRIMRFRVELVLAESDPVFPNWDQDETAIADAYETQDPARVAVEIAEAAAPYADLFVGLTDEQWLRPGRRSEGAVFTVDTLARYALHDVIHHLVDVPPLTGV